VNTLTAPVVAKATALPTRDHADMVAYECDRFTIAKT
jgi:hypothetical protein